MVDWEEILKAESSDELRDAKLWLFQENMRIEKEKEELLGLQDKIIKERTQFRDEMNALNHRSAIERKRIKEEKLFFEKKMAILQNGFQMLEEDRKNLEREKIRFEHEKAFLEEHIENGEFGNVAKALFRNVNNSLTLKKRYRDLVRIFHPDNLCGDAELAQLINKEFQHLKGEI